MPGERLREWGS